MDSQPSPAPPQTSNPSSQPGEPSSNQPTNSPPSPPSKPVITALPVEPASEAPVSVSGPVVMQGQDTTSQAPKRRMKLWPLAASGVFGALLIGAAVYLWVLPTLWANAYIKAVTPVYAKQATQIATVYQSLGRPVFSSQHTSQASNNSDFEYVDSAIATAKNNTDSLEAHNHLRLLPGQALFDSSSSAARTKYQAMQQYVSDSQAFLSDMSTMMTYLQSPVWQSKVPPVTNDLLKLSTSKSASDLSAILPTMAVDLQNLDNGLKQLKPSPDLDQFNTDLLDDVRAISTGVQSFISALHNSNASEAAVAVGEINASVNNYNSYIYNQPTAHLQTSSTLRTQFLNLKADHPLR